MKSHRGIWFSIKIVMKSVQMEDFHDRLSHLPSTNEISLISERMISITMTGTSIHTKKSLLQDSLSFQITIDSEM